MAKFSIAANATSQTVDIFIQANNVTTGAGLTGLAFNTSGLTAYYNFPRAASTSITLATLSTATSAWSSGGFIAIDATNQPGKYRFDIPNACLASGNGRYVGIYLQGATNMAATLLEIELTGVDNQNATTFGMSALPSAAAGASGGLLISGSNSGTTTLAALTVTGATTYTGNVSMAAGLTVTQSTSNTAGISVTGNGTGAGILSTSGGGATGDGIKAVAASTNGNGLNLVGVGTGAGQLTTGGATGNGLKSVGGNSSGDAILTSATSGHGVTFAGTGTTKHGINATGGATTSHGISATGGGVGHGILATSGGGATGDGIRATGASTNGNGLNLIGVGTGAGLLSTAGATGGGVVVAGGSSSGSGVSVTTTSGDAISVLPTAGNALTLTANGTAKHALALTGSAASGANAAGHGILAIGGASSSTAGGTAGVGLKAIGGAGSASNNGAGEGVTLVGGGTTTVNGANGISTTGTGTLNGLLATSGSGATGDGIKGVSAATNGNGFNLVGVGTGSGILATGGATGNGVTFAGGGTSGDGMHLQVGGSGAVLNSTTTALIATTIWTDTTSGDFTTTSSPGKILVSQLGGAFSSTSSSVFSTASLVNAPTGGSAPTAAAIATAVWQDTTSGDFTVASSIGKSLYTSGVVPGGSGGLFIAGTNAATTVTTSFTSTFTGNLTGSVGSVTGAVGSVTGAVGSVTGLTTAAIATAIWTDTTGSDFTTATSPGKIIFTQLGGAFTSSSSSVFSTASLVNAPTGGSAPTTSQIATAVWEDLTAGGDFGTAGSIGKLLSTFSFTSTNVNANVQVNSDKTGYSLTTAPPTTAAIATAVWQDTTSGDFTVASSIGKSLYTSGAVPGATGGVMIAGSNAATTYATLTVSGATTLTGNVALAAGMTVTQSTTNTPGISITGNGTGAGISTTGGITGNGILFVGGSTSGDAILTSTTAGHGATFAGTGTTKHGINATGGATSSDGIRATGGGTGNGINAQSGTGATGDGIVGTANSTNGNGLNLTGAGADHGMLATAGATGDGIHATGGSTSGNGIQTVAATSGSGIRSFGANNGHGLFVSGAGTGNGLQAQATGTGAPINGNITANITGTLATVTNLTNAPTSGDFTSTMKTSLGTAVGTAQTGDSYARIGSTGSGLTSLAQASTALSTANWTNTRAGYLDNLSAGAVALATQIPSNFTTATFASAGVFSVGALANAPTGGSAPTAATIATTVWQDLLSSSDFSTSGSVGALIKANLNAAISTVATSTSVWDQTTTGHTTSGTFGAAMNAAGSAGDPWATSLPGAYGAGTAGHRVGTGIPDIAAGSSNGLMIAGSNAASTFAALTVSGGTTFTGNVALAAGMTITQSTANAAGLSITGNGTGAGLSATGGNTNAAGILATGNGSGAGITGQGGGDGIQAYGGSAGGQGFHANATTGNTWGIYASGHGSGDGIYAAGGATGNGLNLVGGSTSGAGLNVTNTSGNCVAIAGAVSFGSTWTVTGGVTFTAGLTSNIHGTLDTLTTYTNNTPQSADVGNLIGSPLVMTAGKVWALDNNGNPIASASSAPSWYSNAPAASTIATTILTDLVSGSDFQTNGSLGKLLVSNLDTNVGSRMATYTQPSGFLAATFPTTLASHSDITTLQTTANTIFTDVVALGSPMQAGSTVVLTAGSLTTASLGSFQLAKTTNITGFNDIAATAIVSAGAITTGSGSVISVGTTTNLTNAPTVGDFTSTMKADLNAATPTSVGSVTSPVSVNLSQTGLTFRALDAIADASLTVGDAFVCAIAGAAGKETIVDTTYTVMSPHTGTVIRAFALDSPTEPTSRT